MIQMRDEQPNGSAPMTPEDEVEALLPWYVAGSATTAQRALVDNALVNEPSLRHQIELIEEEMHASRLANERAGHVPAKALGRLMDAIELTPQLPGRSRNLAARLQFNVMDWLRRPGILAPVALASLLLLVGQAAVIASLLTKHERTNYSTASSSTPSTAGTRAMIGFAPGATSADIEAFLAQEQLRIVDGPLPGGLYTVQFSGIALSSTDREAWIVRLRAMNRIVRLAMPHGS